MANDNKIFDFGERLGDSVKDRNFGVRTMPQKERWQHMNRAYDSFMDLQMHGASVRVLLL